MFIRGETLLSDSATPRMNTITSHGSKPIRITENLVVNCKTSYKLRANNITVNYDLCLGRQDSSGVNLFYTDKLRKYDSGLVSVGVDINDWQIVPPKQKDWISTGYCMHQCTEVNTEMSLQSDMNNFASRE